MLQQKIAIDKSKLKIEKLIKGKGVKLNVIQKGCDTLVNSWIDKKYVIIKNEPIFY